MHQELVSELQSITTVLEAKPDCFRYQVDGQMPLLVVVPGGEAEVAACLQVAGRHGAAVAPRGAGTKGDLGNVPKLLDIVLSLERLNQVIEYVPADLTVTVQAGMRFADLQALVAQHDQTVPIDPPRGSAATVGGIVAAGSVGPQRLAYGSMRDLLLGTRVALPDGRLIKTGSRVVKNVAGYDLNKLLVGSLGTLGVMTEITLKLRPLPAMTRTLRFGFPNLAVCLQAAEAVLYSELLPVAVTALSACAALRLGTPGPVTLIVQLAETVANVAYQQERLGAITMPGASATDCLIGARESAFWELVRNYGDQFGAAFTSKVNTVISAVGDLLQYSEQAHQGLAIDGIAHVGTGTVYLYGFDQGSGPTGAATAAEALFACAQAGGGTAVLESAAIGVKRLVDVWGPVRPEWQIMQGIKRTFDPGGILNPGRYIGGI